MYSKSKDQFLENQIRDAQDRNAMAEQQHREHMAYGELEAATTITDLQAAMLSNLNGMLLTCGCNPEKVGVLMSGIRYYGEAVRLEMIERRFDTSDTFGSTLTDAERDYVIKMHP